MERERGRDKGFTLIEVLVATTILGVVTMTLISVFIRGYNLTLRSKQIVLAAQICQEEVENVRNMSFDAILNLGSSFTNDKLASCPDVNGLVKTDWQTDFDNNIYSVDVNHWLARTVDPSPRAPGRAGLTPWLRTSPNSP